ncbi:helix-turn-helix transcriptional regulator [Gelria sp. Kuro-4]|jgi:DNA-binding XRE family transcriptional regulator|uniref:helix-turn-helix transcriptional regulator n=1 Tax=Gelria sp. Kuro-4 TaxID=2796927 RepID=UPI001C81C52A|nr:helix-turn-helix domain-containing protein [Gelria sp. Kuro-4]
MRCELIRARKKARLTQKQLAELVGIERSTYAHIERGRSPSFQVALAIAGVLRRPVEDLFLPHRVLKDNKR